MPAILLSRLLILFLVLGTGQAVHGATGDEDTPHRPRWVFSHAVLQAQNSTGTTAVVDTNDRLWLTAWPGSSWVLPHSRLEESVDGIEFGDLLVLWSTERSGLWIRNELQIRSHTGNLLETESVEAPILDVISNENQVAVLLPGEFRLIRPRRSETQTIPLPFIHPQSAEILDGKWVIRDGLDQTIIIDPATGCPEEYDPGTRALDRWMYHHTASVCGDPPALPRNVEQEALFQRNSAIEAAALSSDQITLAAMGVRTRAQMQRIRPAERRGPGNFRTRDDGIADVPEQLLGTGFTVFVKHPDSTIPLRDWVMGSHAPACHARILMIPETEAISLTLQLRLRILRTQGANCANSLYLTEVDAIDLDYDWAWYVDDEGHRVGRRTGKPTARQVRMDLARLQEDDPLRYLAERPELYTEWTEGPGPSYEVRLDIDGSWVADSGWDLLTGSPRLDRSYRVELAGPVRDIVVREDGLVEAMAGGQPVRVEFRWGSGTVEWLDEWPDSQGVDTARISAERSSATGDLGENWQITNGVVHRPANEEERAGPQPSSASERLQENEVEPPNQLEGRESEMEMMPDMGGPRMVDGHIVVNLPIAATRAEPIDGGAIIMTSFGLVAIDTGGSIRWRLTEVSDFVVSGDWLIVTTPWGVRGHRIPPPIQQTQPGGSH